MPPQFSSVTTWGHGKAEPQRHPLQTTTSPLLAVLEFLILHPLFSCSGCVFVGTPGVFCVGSQNKAAEH